MFDGEGVAEFVVYYFFHEEQIEVVLVVLLELFGGEFVLVALFADFGVGADAGAVLYGAESEDPGFLEFAGGVVAVVDQQVRDDGDRVALLGQALCEVRVHQGRIVVSVVLLRLQRVEPRQIDLIVELVQFNFDSGKEGLRVLFELPQDLLGELAMESCDVDDLLLLAEVVAVDRGEEREGLALLLVLVEIVARPRFLDGVEVFEDGEQRLLDPPLLAGQRPQCAHPLLLVRDYEGDHAGAVAQRVDPFGFGLLRGLVWGFLLSPHLFIKGLFLW